MAESPEGALITLNVGALTDAQGNIYTITGAQNAATKNGKAMSGGGNTSLMVYHNHTVYGQDGTSRNWYIWNGAGWTATAQSPVSASVLISTVSVAFVGPQHVNVPFTVTGTFHFDGDAPVTNFEYLDDSGANKPAGATTSAPGVYKFSFLHPGYSAPGTYTVTVGAAGGVTAKSNTFQVT